MNKISSIFLAAVLVAGTLAITISSSFALPYIPYFADPYAKNPYSDPYAKDHKKKASDVNVQKIKCVNENTNINGVDINQLPPPGNEPVVTAQLENGPENGNGNGNDLLGDGINIDRNLLNICANINLNGQANGVPVIGDITSTLP